MQAFVLRWLPKGVVLYDPSGKLVQNGLWPALRKLSGICRVAVIRDQDVCYVATEDHLDDHEARRGETFNLTHVAEKMHTDAAPHECLFIFHQGDEVLNGMFLVPAVNAEHCTRIVGMILQQLERRSANPSRYTKWLQEQAA